MSDEGVFLLVSIFGLVTMFGLYIGDHIYQEGGMRTYEEQLATYNNRPTKANLEVLWRSLHSGTTRDLKESLHAHEAMGSISEIAFYFKQDEWGREYSSLLADTQKALLQQQEWKTLSALYEEGVIPIDFRYSPHALRYQGTSPPLLAHRGLAELQQGMPRTAYETFTDAALIDRSFAKYPRSMALQFGCTDLYSIWGALTDKTVSFGTAALPPERRTLNNAALYKARQALLDGSEPTEAGSCTLLEQAT
tara:strand:+ start:103 stop:852 length:750 start_codon:yes stop_codon:yes gene_type:complete